MNIVVYALLRNTPWREKYRRKWQRRKEAGDPNAKDRLIVSRLFLPIAFGFVGENGDVPALNGISIPISDKEIDPNSIDVIAAAFTRFSMKIRAAGGDLENIRKALKSHFRTIRLDEGGSFHLFWIVAPPAVTEALMMIRQYLESISGFPGNFRLSRHLYSAIMGLEEGVDGHALLTSILTQYLRPAMPTQEKVRDEADQEAEERAYSGDFEEEPSGPDYDGYEPEEEEEEEGEEGEDIGGEERPGGYEEPGEEGKGDGSPDEESPMGVLPFDPGLVQDVSMEESQQGLSFSVPHPELAILHAVSSPLGYVLGLPVLSGLPLWRYYPALLLVLLEALLSHPLLSLAQSGRADPLLIAALYLALLSVGMAGVVTAYRMNGHEIRIHAGILAIAKAILTAVSTALRVAMSFSKKPKAESAAMGVTSIQAPSSVALDVGSSDGASQISDVLAVLAVLAGLFPHTHFLIFPLLAISLSVERKSPFLLPVLSILGYGIRFFASNPVQHMVGMAFVLAGLPGVRMVKTEELREEWRQSVSRLRSLPRAISDALRILRSEGWRRAIRLLRREEALPDVPSILPAPHPHPDLFQDNVVRTLSAELESILGVRRTIEDYVSRLEAALRSRLPRPRRAQVEIALRYWRRVLSIQEPLVYLVPEPGVTLSPLRIAHHPAVGSVPVNESVLLGASRDPFPRRMAGRIFEPDLEGADNPYFGTPLKDLLSDPDQANRIILKLAQLPQVKSLQRAGEILVSADSRFPLGIPMVLPITEEKKRRWMNLAQDGKVPTPVFLKKPPGILLPFAVSSFRTREDGVDGHAWFGMLASPRANAHAIVAAPTRGGKTAMMRALIRSILLAYERDFPFSVGLIAVDGKTDLVASFAPIRDHPAVFAPPLAFDTRQPYEAIYYISAVRQAMIRREEAYRFLSQAIYEFLEGADRGRRSRVLEALGGNPLEGAGSALELFAALFPGYGAVMLMIDELWGMMSSIDQTARTISVRIDPTEKEQKVQATDVIQAAILDLILKGASAGFIVWVASQSTRKEAISHPALRDNASILRGTGVSGAVIHALLTDSMKTQESRIVSVYRATGGKDVDIPTQYCFAAYMRGSGFARCAFPDRGSPIVILGKDEAGGEIYELDIFYPPFVGTEHLAFSSSPKRLDRHAAAVREIVRFAAEAHGVESVPDVLKPFLDRDPSEAVMAFCRETLGARVDAEQMIRMGQNSVIDIARIMRGQTLSS